MQMKRLAVLTMVFVFLLTASLALAAAEKFFVIKDKNGVCKVISAKEKTPKTIAGPFSSKAQAQAAKEKKCPAAAKPAKKKKSEAAKSTVKRKAKKAKESKAAKKKDTKSSAKDKKKK
jgi:hypothetical protein